MFKKLKGLLIVTVFCLMAIGIKVQASPDNSQKIKVTTEFLDEMSGGNKFIFKVKLDEEINGVVKGFFIEEGKKMVPVATYEISNKNYIIVVTPSSKEFSINNVNLGITTVVNRAEKNIEGVALLNAKNVKFKTGQVISEPMLSYHDQDTITVAVQIDDPWDTLKNVQAILVYPDLRKDFEVSFEKKYVLVSDKLKQFVYINMKSFKDTQVLKFNLNLLFQLGLNDVSLGSVNKVFAYNFDSEKIVEEFIESVYSNLLGRKPTSVEIKKYLKSLTNNSISSTNFIIGIVQGNEFKNIGMSNPDFVEKIYKIIFNRIPDNNGKDFWVNELKKSSRVDVLKEILKSDEYIRTMKEIGITA